jgi:broad specificity phosphatase PhoE
MAALTVAADASGRTVYLIRHAESRYNEAKKEWNLKGLVGERDHPLSDTGIAQCARLHLTLQTAAASGDENAQAIISREKTLSSPLCRAILTAHLALPYSGQAPPHVVAIAQAREHCMMPVFARDSIGTPRDAINAKVSLELAAVNNSRPTASAVDEGRSTDAPFLKAPIVDVSYIREEAWWIVGEKEASIAERLGKLMLFLYSETQGGGKSESGAAAVVLVAHSRIIRALFRKFSVCSSEFADKLVDNCAVVRLTIAIKAGEISDPPWLTPRITNAVFLFGSGFK